MSNGWQEQPRNADGKFGERSSAEPDLEYLPASGEDRSTLELELRDQLQVSGEALWDLVESENPADRATAAESIHLDSEQLSALSQDDSFAVRSAMALRPEPAAVSAASQDQDPVVRAIALRSGIGLGPEARQRLHADAGVVRVRSVVGE